MPVQASRTAPGVAQRRSRALRAADTVHEVLRGQESCTTLDPEQASASISTGGSTAAFLSRKGVLNAGGQIMLKSLTYGELEQWCMSVGMPCCKY